MAIGKPKDLPHFVAKLKRDIDLYKVYGIDWLNETLLLFYNSEYVNIEFDRIDWVAHDPGILE